MKLIYNKNYNNRVLTKHKTLIKKFLLDKKKFNHLLLDWKMLFKIIKSLWKELKLENKK